MDVVAQARAVRRRVVGAEYRHAGTATHRRFARDLDEQRRFRCRLPDRAARLAAGHVEIAQRDVTGAAGIREVVQHPLGHQLGRSVGVNRADRTIFISKLGVGDAVDCCSR